MTETAEQLCQRAADAQLGYREFLDLVLDEEVAIRESRRFANALKLSGLPHRKSLDEFDFAFQPDLDPRKIKHLATLTFIDQKARRRTCVCSVHPGSARPCSPSAWPSPRARPAIRGLGTSQPEMRRGSAL